MEKEWMIFFFFFKEYPFPVWIITLLKIVVQSLILILILFFFAFKVIIASFYYFVLLAVTVAVVAKFDVLKTSLCLHECIYFPRQFAVHLMGGTSKLITIKLKEP